MASGEDPRLRLLRRLGFDRVEHDSHVPFLSHLLGTARLLREWGCRPALCDGGLFHSAYGTEYFELEEPADRDLVRSVIGAEAERVAWLWCTVRRETVDAGAGTAVDRHTGDPVELTDRDLTDVATLWAADTVEQVARMTPDERGFATGILGLLDHVPPPGREAVEGVRELLAG